MPTPRSGNSVTVFRSRLDPAALDAHGPMADEMLERARRTPGFVSIESFVAADGERLSLVVFESLDAQEVWRRDARHRVAQQRGREEFYTEYSVAVCECVRAHEFVRG